MGCISLYGSRLAPVLPTPNLDRIGREGALFTRCYCTNSICTPARATILTGQYSHVNGVRTLDDPLDTSINVGPVACEEQEHKILKYIKVGIDEGAKLLLGGRKLTNGDYRKGFFIEPTIFETIHGLRITREEIFGPVLAVIKALDYEEAVKIANDVDYGLSASIYSSDINTTYRAIDDLETGITYINAPTIGAETHLPFGGVKESGLGREGSKYGIDEFLEIKYLTLAGLG